MECGKSNETGIEPGYTAYEAIVLPIRRFACRHLLLDVPGAPPGIRTRKACMRRVVPSGEGECGRGRMLISLDGKRDVPMSQEGRELGALELACGSWLAIRELNPDPLAWKAKALPLSLLLVCTFGVSAPVADHGVEPCSACMRGGFALRGGRVAAREICLPYEGSGTHVPYLPKVSRVRVDDRVQNACSENKCLFQFGYFPISGGEGGTRTPKCVFDRSW